MLVPSIFLVLAILSILLFKLRFRPKRPVVDKQAEYMYCRNTVHRIFRSALTRTLSRQLAANEADYILANFKERYRDNKLIQDFDVKGGFGEMARIQLEGPYNGN